MNSPYLDQPYLYTSLFCEIINALNFLSAGTSVTWGINTLFSLECLMLSLVNQVRKFTRFGVESRLLESSFWLWSNSFSRGHMPLGLALHRTFGKLESQALTPHCIFCTVAWVNDVCRLALPTPSVFFDISVFKFLHLLCIEHHLVYFDHFLIIWARLNICGKHTTYVVCTNSIVQAAYNALLSGHTCWVI